MRDVELDRDKRVEGLGVENHIGKTTETRIIREL